MVGKGTCPPNGQKILFFIWVATIFVNILIRSFLSPQMPFQDSLPAWAILPLITLDYLDPTCFDLKNYLLLMKCL